MDARELYRRAHRAVRSSSVPPRVGSDGVPASRVRDGYQIWGNAETAARAVRPDRYTAEACRRFWDGRGRVTLAYLAETRQKLAKAKAEGSETEVNMRLYFAVKAHTKRRAERGAEHAQRELEIVESVPLDGRAARTLLKMYRELVQCPETSRSANTRNS